MFVERRRGCMGLVGDTIENHIDITPNACIHELEANEFRALHPDS